MAKDFSRSSAREALLVKQSRPPSEHVAMRKAVRAIAARGAFPVPLRPHEQHHRELLLGTANPDLRAEIGMTLHRTSPPARDRRSTEPILDPSPKCFAPSAFQRSSQFRLFHFARGNRNHLFSEFSVDAPPVQPKEGDGARRPCAFIPVAKGMIFCYVKCVCSRNVEHAGGWHVQVKMLRLSECGIEKVFVQETGLSSVIRYLSRMDLNNLPRRQKPPTFRQLLRQLTEHRAELFPCPLVNLPHLSILCIPNGAPGYSVLWGNGRDVASNRMHEFVRCRIGRGVEAISAFRAKRASELWLNLAQCEPFGVILSR